VRTRNGLAKVETTGTAAGCSCEMYRRLPAKSDESATSAIGARAASSRARLLRGSPVRPDDGGGRWVGGGGRIQAAVRTHYRGGGRGCRYRRHVCGRLLHVCGRLLHVCDRLLHHHRSTRGLNDDRPVERSCQPATSLDDLWVPKQHRYVSSCRSGAILRIRKTTPAPVLERASTLR